jgi:hypothetical protein
LKILIIWITSIICVITILRNHNKIVNNVRSVFRVREYRKRFGDRNDGRLLRSIDSFFKIIPYIMPTRIDAQVFFEHKVEIDRIEAYVKEKRNTEIKNLSMLHIIIASLVRTVSQKPALNRFIAGQKVFARNEILISLAVKKELTVESPETTIKLKFDPNATIYDIVRIIDAALVENKQMENENGADKMAKLFMMCPGLLVKFLVGCVKSMDYFGIMPKVINDVSPFHTSIFVTDLGSIGIEPVFHHLYAFGTTSIFVAFGTKRKEKSFDRNNNIVEKKYINIKVVADERITDGHYYATALRVFNRYIMHPERLELPPEEVFEDME